MDERVSIRRITGHAVRDLPCAAIVQVMEELGPEGGDFVVLRATPDRAAAIEQNLVAQLFTMGAHVAGEPLRGNDEPDGRRRNLWCARCGTHTNHTAMDHHPDDGVPGV